MSEIRIFTVDAFTDRPFAGNPAGVAVLETEADASWMQSVAAEMNLAETAFLVPGADGVWGLRWFTPTVEVDLCGHATLASAHVLLETGLAAADEKVRFSTRSGILSARQAGDGMIAMDFPAEPAVETAPPDGLLDALGVTAPVWVGRNRFDALVEVGDEGTVRKLDPDFAALAAIDVRGAIVTAPAPAADDGADFVSRFFGPAVGVNEDPVTGSAHCALAPFWSARLGHTTLQGRQLSARGGLVAVQVCGDRVILGGRAVTVLEGSLRVGLR